MRSRAVVLARDRACEGSPLLAGARAGADVRRMPLRYGIPLTLTLLALCLYVGYAFDFAFYWWLVGAVTLVSLREARVVGLRDHATSLALPPVGFIAVMALGFPFVLPWFLRVRHRILTGRLPAGPGAVGRGSYVLVGGIAAVSGLAALQFARLGLSGEVERLTSVAHAVSGECGAPVTVSRSGARLTTVVFGGMVSLAPALQRPLARRIAHAAWRAHPHRDSIAASEVVFREADRRGDVTVTRDVARYRWPREEFAIQAESEALNAADDTLATNVVHHLFAGDLVGLASLPLDSTITGAEASFAPMLRLIDSTGMRGRLDSLRPATCQSFHAENGLRWRTLFVYGASRVGVVEVVLRSRGAETLLHGLHFGLRPLIDTL